MASSVFLTISGSVLNTGDGSAATPSHSFLSDPTTGQYLIGAGNEGFSAGGALRFDYNTTRLLSTLPYYAPDGAVGAPSVAFGTNTSSGLYINTTNQPAIAAGGLPVARFIGGNIDFPGNVTLSWGSGTNAFATADLILTRDAANTLAQKNGTNAQTFRVYGNETGSKYLQMAHDGTNATIAPTSGFLNLGSTSFMTKLITSGATPGTVADGDVWIDTAAGNWSSAATTINLKARNNGVTRTIASVTF